MSQLSNDLRRLRRSNAKRYDYISQMAGRAAREYSACRHPGDIIEFAERISDEARTRLFGPVTEGDRRRFASRIPREELAMDDPAPFAAVAPGGCLRPEFALQAGALRMVCAEAA